MEQIQFFPYPIDALDKDIVKSMWIHSTRSSIRRAGAIKEMIYTPARDAEEAHEATETTPATDAVAALPALYYIVESVTPATYYKNATEYNEAVHPETDLTDEEFEALTKAEKMKTAEIKMCSIHALSSDISKFLLLNSLPAEEAEDDEDEGD